MTTLQELYDIYKDTACEEGLKCLQDCISQELTVDEAINNADVVDLKWVASHPETPVDILVKLGKHDAWEVRYEVADNPNTPARILEQLSTDSSPFVRYCVVFNTNTPIEAMEQMAWDNDYDVRKAVRRRLGISSRPTNKE